MTLGEGEISVFFASPRQFGFFNFQTDTSNVLMWAWDIQGLRCSDIIYKKQHQQIGTFTLRLAQPFKRSRLQGSFAKNRDCQTNRTVKNWGCKTHEIGWKVWETHSFGRTIHHPLTCDWKVIWKIWSQVPNYQQQCHKYRSTPMHRLKKKKLTECLWHCNFLARFLLVVVVKLPCLKDTGLKDFL